MSFFHNPPPFPPRSLREIADWAYAESSAEWDKIRSEFWSNYRKARQTLPEPQFDFDFVWWRLKGLYRWVSSHFAP